MPDDSLDPALPPWTFLTNHAHVLVCITRDPEIRIADISRLVGIGQRAVHTIIQDLIDAGYLTRTKRGRRNHYDVDLAQPLRHPLEARHLVADVFVPITT